MTTPFKTTVSDDVKQAQAAMQARLLQRRDPATGVLTAAQPATGVAPGYRAEDFAPRGFKCWVAVCTASATDDVVYAPSEVPDKAPERPVPGLDGPEAFAAYRAWERTHHNPATGQHVPAPFETRLCPGHLAHWASARASFWSGRFESAVAAWNYAVRCPGDSAPDAVYVPPKRRDVPLQHLQGPALHYKYIDPTQELLLVWDDFGQTSVELAPRVANFAEARGWSVNPA